MTVLFGTFEYFHREIVNHLNEHGLKEKMEEELSFITTKLENEILYDFICDERLRRECIKNLRTAKEIVRQSMCELQVV